jgi:hypothetical protein
MKEYSTYRGGVAEAQGPDALQSVAGQGIAAIIEMGHAINLLVTNEPSTDSMIRTSSAQKSKAPQS